MQKAQLIATVLGAAVLAFGAAQAGPMGGMGMQPSPTGTLSGSPDRTFNTHSTQNGCDQNMASRIPCKTNKTKAKTDAKAKGAASADQSGANANATPAARANTAASGAADPAAGAPP